MEEQNLTSNNWGGKRKGAGRPQGALQKAPKVNYECNFMVRCSFKQRELLKAYWKTIKHEV